MVAPGADPGKVRLHFEGAKKLALAANGDLEVYGANGQIAFHKPLIYQIIDGRRSGVGGGFSLEANNEVRFPLAQYDKTKAVVIDPVLMYSTYFGGTGTSGYGDYADSIAVDNSGDVYISGSAESIDFPVSSGAYSKDLGASAFIVKINPAGTAIAYSTCIGSQVGALGHSVKLAIDASGNVYVTSFTLASDFPTTSGAFQKANKAALGKTGFVSKLSASGSSLIYSTYLGGSMTDYPYAITVDSSGNAYLAGATMSTDFPVTSGAVQTTNKNTNSGGTGFISKLNTTGTALVFSTYLGGSSGDMPQAVAVDSSHNVYIGGLTTSLDYPVTSGAVQSSAPYNYGYGFLSKISSDGSKLSYSTYIGGSGNAWVNDIKVDSSGNIYAVGFTYDGFPTTSGVAQSAYPGTGYYGAGFLAKIGPSSGKLLVGTYIGGSGAAGTCILDIVTNTGCSDEPNAVTLDASGNIYVAGTTTSSNFQVTSAAYQAKNAGGSDGFLSVYNASATSYLYSSYFGGGQDDGVYGIAVDTLGSIYIAGATKSTNLPISSGAIQQLNNAGQANGANAFVAKFSSVTATPTASTPTFNPAANTYSAAQSVAISDTTPGATIYYTTDGTTPTTSSPQYGGAITVSQNTTIEAMATASGYTQSAVASATYNIMAATPTFSPAGGPYTTAQNVTISDTTPGATIYYTTDGTTPTTSSTKYTAAIAVSSTKTIQAIAVATGYANSGVGVASYTISVTAQTTPTVAVTAASSTITTAQSLQVTVKVSGSGSTPTGSIVLTSSGYTATPATLSGGSATITVPAGSLAVGIDTVTATYTPDSSSASAYTSATGTATVTVTATTGAVAPTVTVTPSSTSITAAQSLTVVVGVTGGSGKSTPTGSVKLSSGSYTSSAATLSSGSASITVPAGTLAVGSDTLTATYTPDSASSSTYTSGSGSASVTVTSTTAASFSVAGTAVTLKAGATQGNTSTITVTPANGFTGSVILSAAVTSSPSGASYPPTMSFGSTSPVSIAGSSAGTATLSVTTTATTSAASLAHPSGNGIPWTAATGVSLAGVFLILLIPRSRSWRSLLVLLLGVGLTAIAGCSGSGTKTSGGTSGTTPGTYTITVIGTSGSTTSAGTITLTVQ